MYEPNREKTCTNTFVRGRPVRVCRVSCQERGNAHHKQVQSITTTLIRQGRPQREAVIHEARFEPEARGRFFFFPFLFFGQKASSLRGAYVPWYRIPITI